MKSKSSPTDKNQEPKAFSYQDFKKEFYAGLKHIEKSGWTDVNTHDPGVTILDVLFYALTDLIYRTGFDIKDILASYQGIKLLHTTASSSPGPGPAEPARPIHHPIPGRRPKKPPCFGIPTDFDSHFPAFQEVLPVTPITVFDYRKYMLDLVYQDSPDQFVARNIWFEKADTSEVDIVNIGEILNVVIEAFLNDVPPDLSEYFGPPGRNYRSPFLELNGLYEVVVELPAMLICDKFMDKKLGTAILTGYDPATGLPLSPDDLAARQLLMCDWYPISGNAFRTRFRPQDNPGDLDNDVYYCVEVVHPYFDEMARLYKWNSPVTGVSLVDDNLGQIISAQGQYLFDGELKIEFDGGASEVIAVRVEILGLCKEFTKVLIAKTPDLGTPIPESIIDSLKQLLITQPPLYLIDKMTAVIKALKELKSYFLASRNLCEDFVRFKAARVEEIAVNGTFAIEEGVDEEAVLADLFFQLDRFISPPVRFSNYEQMENLSGENNGKKPFDEIFEGPLLKHGFIEEKEIEKSDNITAIYMSDLVNIIMDVEGIAWVDQFSLSSFIDLVQIKTNEKNYLELSEPKRYKPKFRIEKCNIRIKKGVRIFKDIYELDLLKIYALMEERRLLESENQNPIKIASDKYVGLPQTPEGTRLNLSDYKSIQNDFPLVYGIGDHGLPKNASEERKAQALQLKGYLFIIEQLLANFLSQICHIKGLFSYREDVPDIDYTYFWKLLFEIPQWKKLISTSSAFPECDETLPVPSPKTDLETLYGTTLQSIIESRDTFFQRKNTFLDHLMARFGENLNEFQALLKAFVIKEGKDPNDFFKDRKTFYLQALPQLAANRPRAFNYCQKDAKGDPGVWDTDNISYLQKRLCHKLGLDNCCRRDLVVCEEAQKPSKTKGTALTKATGKKIAGKSAKSGAIKKQALKYGPKMINFVKKARKKLKPASDNSIFKNMTLMPLKNYRVPDCLKAIEGFYMIEHILLRPKSRDHETPLMIWDYKGDAITEIGQFRFEKFRFIEDPYSFHLTFIFPKAEGKFSDIEYQHYVRRTIRNEVPSHIIPHIFWLDKAFVYKFQELYKKWLRYLCIHPFLEDVSSVNMNMARSTRKSMVLFLMFIWIQEVLDESVNPFD